MKRAFFVAALMIQAAVMAGVVHAQTDEPRYLRLPHRFQIFLEGGGALPTSPSVWKELWNSSFDFGLGFGGSVFPWLEINAGFNTTSFSLDDLQAKGVIGYQGLQEVQGGTISTKNYYGSARFIAVPHARTNPYVEAMVGYFSTSAEDVVIEDVLVNTMESVKGMSVGGAVGIQYSLSDAWSAYAKYTYTDNLNGDFSPGDLVQPLNGSREEPQGDQKIQSLMVGIMVLF